MESNIHELLEVTDDTKITQLQLEMEGLKKELLFMKKNHEEGIKALPVQIASSVLTVDAPKSQDLSKIPAELWAQNDELAQKNLMELDKY